MLAIINGNEWIYLLILVVVVFGGAKIPQLARSLGQAQNEFKKGLSEDADDNDEDDAKSSK
ncbi:MAG: twin-arginine translocase TatA/TatE family subunit [Acidimicrobiales bacterium]|nr:twin-arginine translocase TatA/TatE family subunit [Acidimicrobiales bacterium]GJM37639.1 MAG: hypothetical protein DHS20C19_10060 [Acidimicrobiales bacterium]